ncbi:hypothetical protein GMORB2_2671 [Geosmithia morbida]|uniref:Uncharacterized protein n=1 Tax=Geosmithia morbida TaxID=1094350 RepID=A0A9P4YPC9_9HYPO|nr:uncharacterized protein GMORB2_2671 [Geosmithia morbida]KAF4120668.1 hypothetical protein GMORB2_2671 [Geosmithia morbida]
MGKPDEDMAKTGPTHLQESASAISLQTQEQDGSGSSTMAHLPPPPPAPTDRYFDDDAADVGGGDDDDLPPLYSDLEHGLAAEQTVVDPLLPAGVGPLAVAPFSRDETTGTEYYVDRRLDTDAIFLASHVRHLAMLPPRPFVHLRGTHTETKRKSDSKTEQQQVIDFDVRVELTDLLYADLSARTPQRRQVLAAGTMEKVRRGTVFPTRAQGFGGKGYRAEDRSPESDLLDDWCRHFCSSKAGLKTFSVERRVVGFDFDALRPKLESLVRRTNYRGSLTVDFPLLNSHAHIYNDCRSNRWRLTRWIVVVFTLTLLSLLTWPWLFFRTARWEVIGIEWLVGDGGTSPGRRSQAEERWYNLWARPIQRAVLSRRQGTLNQADLTDSLDPQPEQRTGMAGAVQAGVEAMGVVNRSFGWGGST